MNVLLRFTIITRELGNTKFLALIELRPFLMKLPRQTLNLESLARNIVNKRLIIRNNLVLRNWILKLRAIRGTPLIIGPKRPKYKLNYHGNTYITSTLGFHLMTWHVLVGYYCGSL